MGSRRRIPSREEYRAWLICFAGYIAYREATTRHSSVVSSRSFVVLQPDAATTRSAG
jgi:hypothetical protein